MFGDWQGLTRIVSPGDKVKTDANLDRPHEKKPFVLRPNGMIWFEYLTDIDPATLKKVRPAVPESESPDPIAEGTIAVSFDGTTATISGTELSLAPSGGTLRLGGPEGPRATAASTSQTIIADGSFVVLGRGSKDAAPHVALVVRGEGGAPRVAFSRPLARLEGGEPRAYRRAGEDVTWIADRDPRENVAYLVAIADDGAVRSETHTAAVAGPWVHEGRVYWQSDDGSLSEGARLGDAETTHPLPEAHRGPGNMLRMKGRKLFLPHHRTTMLDLAPAKKGKSEISRKHKAADEALYREAERILLPVTRGLARRGIAAHWSAATRHGKTIIPVASFAGRTDVIADATNIALRYGGAAALRRLGATNVSSSGGGDIGTLLAPPAPITAEDIRAHVAIVDAAGLSRASGLPSLFDLAKRAKERGAAVPWTDDAEREALAAVLSGIRLESSAPPPPPTAEAIAEVAPLLSQRDFASTGISSSDTAMFVAFAAHRLLGASAAEPMTKLLTESNRAEVMAAVGIAVPPPAPIAPPPAPALSPEDAAARKTLEATLARLGADPAASREAPGWYRFAFGGYSFEAGVASDIRIVGTLCATDTDVDLDALMKSLAASNTSLERARFFEADGYVRVRATCARADATEDTLAALVEECRAAFDSDAGRRLKTSWETMG